MKLLEMDLKKASDFLGLQILTDTEGTRLVNSEGVEKTIADADYSIAESLDNLALAEQSPLVGGAQYWHLRNISAWTVVKNCLNAEEN